MSDVAAAPGLPAGRTLLDRFLAAIPFAIAALVILSILLWEASVRKTPTIFNDEVEWAQISRAIAATGHAARRGQPVSFKSLYAFLIAPCWWIHSTAAAYAAVRYLNTIVMALTAIPVYLLARTLVSPRTAAIVALGAICTTAMFFATLLLPEVLAYPTFALYAYVVVRVLAGGGRRWLAASLVLSVVVVEVRGQLICAVGAYALAALWLWLVGPRGRRLRARWNVADHAGAIVLLVGVFVLVNRVVLQHSHQWQYTSQYYSGRIWHYALVSYSALAIGLGVLPLLGGLVSLWLPEQRANPRWRAFAAFLGASLLSFGLYTGVKAAYLSTNVFSRVEERNLIYLGPLLLVGTAVVLSTRRPPLPTVAVATAVTAWLVLHFGYQLQYPYFESPGYGIAEMANRSFHWTQPDIRRALAVTVAISLAVVTAPRWLGSRRIAIRAVVLAATLGTATWMLAAEVTSARGVSVSADNLVNHLPRPLDWIDQATHDQGVTYLGQEIGNADGLHTLEFWNRYSLRNIWSLDATAPGPGPFVTPFVDRPDGRLTGDPGLPYVLADNGVDVQGTVIKRYGDLLLTRIDRHPWHLRQAVYGRTGDGWIANSHDGGYAYFGPERAPGTVVVTVGREGFNATTAPNTHVTVTVGPVALDQQGIPYVAHPIATRRLRIVNGAAAHTLTFRLRPPLAVHVHVDELVNGTRYNGDARDLGVQVGYSFTPTR